MGMFSFNSKLSQQVIHLQAPKKSKVYARALVATTGEVCKSPEAWADRIINFCCMGTNGFILVGNDATVTGNTDMSALDGGTKVLTVDDNTVFPLPQGVIVPYYFDSQDLYFFIMCAASTAGVWYASPGSPNKAGQP